MNSSQFSSQFDILYNNISSNVAPGLNNYEKSTFLTIAQEEYIDAMYGGVTTSFEATEEGRRLLNNLIKTAEINVTSTTNGITNNSYLVTLPNDVKYITYEAGLYTNAEIAADKCLKNLDINKKFYISVVPTTQDELSKIINNPFRGASDRRILRLDCGKDNQNNQLIELVSDKALSKYIVRYIKKPYPIILEDLSVYGTDINGDSLSIDGKSTPFSDTEVCELDSSSHYIILKRAVELAKAAFIGSSAS